jgi:glycosyltransferase involved in cell wall biosynthesis
MQIAIMMRAMDQDSGHRAIIEGLVDNMLQMDQLNTYLLLYRTDKWLGRFSSYPNVKEVLLKAPHKLVWDQVAVPYTAWREGADVIYNPKFSVPLVTHCPVVMGLHEPVWWAWPEHYEWLDVRYMRLMFPLYCRKTSHFFAISDFVIGENRKYLGLPFDNATVTYPAPKEYFKPIEDLAALERFRLEYDLPRRFIVSVTRVDHPGLDGSTSFFPGKNVETTVRAFMMCRDHIPHKLVIAGRRVREYLLHLGFTDSDLEDIHFTDFVPHEQVPMLYNLAELFILPSFYESYAMTFVEAMSCGCPAIAAQTGACPEISGGAALLADPYDPADFADKMMRVLKNNDVRQQLKSKSLKRAADFKWKRTAGILLEELTRVVSNGSTASSSA